MGDKAESRPLRRQRHHDHLRLSNPVMRSKNPYTFHLSGERRETNEGRGSQEQARMEITKGDINEGRQMKGDKLRQEQPRAGQNGDRKGKQMKGDK